MNRTRRWGAMIAAGVPLMFLVAGQAEAKSAYAKSEGKPCSHCHVGKTSDMVFTEAGKQYAAHHTLKGSGEAANAPGPTADGAAGTAVKPSGDAAPDPSRKAAMDPQTAEPSPPCDCDCMGCEGKPCGHHGHKHGGGMMPPRMEQMQGHLREMQQAVSDLRENEKTLEAAAGPDPFRAAVLEHLRKLDDLQASHLKHMEGMMRHAPPGKEDPHPHHGK